MHIAWQSIWAVLSWSYNQRQCSLRVLWHRCPKPLHAPLSLLPLLRLLPPLDVSDHVIHHHDLHHESVSTQDRDKDIKPLEKKFLRKPIIPLKEDDRDSNIQTSISLSRKYSTVSVVSRFFMPTFIDPLDLGVYSQLI